MAAMNGPFNFKNCLFTKKKLGIPEEISPPDDMCINIILLDSNLRGFVKTLSR